MTKIIGHTLPALDTSNPTWQNSDQMKWSSIRISLIQFISLHGLSPTIQPFYYMFFLTILIGYMGQAQHFSLFYFWAVAFSLLIFYFLAIIFWSRSHLSDGSHLITLPYTSESSNFIRFFWKWVPLVRFPLHTFSNRIHNQIFQIEQNTWKSSKSSKSFY